MQSPSSNVPTSHKEQQQLARSKPGSSPPQGKWSRHRKKLLKRIGLPSTIVGIVTMFFSFFPHLTISEPATMDSGQLLSKYMTINNEGVLPVFRVHCGIAVKKILMDNGSGMEGPDDFTGRIEHTGCYSGTLSPGDSYTFTLENILQTRGVKVTGADFAVVISYIPILPPVRMDKCVHFVLHESTNGEKYWFRSPGHCAFFPWLHF